MGAYKFLIIDESVAINSLSQMKREFDVKKIYRITSKTSEIPGLPKIDWHQFHHCHSYFYWKLIDAKRLDKIAMYLFTGNPKGVMWSLKSTNPNHRFFEIDCDSFLEHVDEVMRLAEIEQSFHLTKANLEAAEFNLEKSITNDQGSYLDIAKELDSLHQQVRSEVAVSEKFQKLCFSYYSKISSQPWSESAT